MTKAREIAELGQKLTVDASGNLDIAGTAAFDGRIYLEASTGFANLEMGGPDGAYIDLKSPFSDDYDGRVIWDGSDMIITTGATGNVVLKKNNATRLKTSTDGIEVTNRVGIGTSPVYPLHIFDNNTDRDMDANAGGQLFIDGNGYGFGIALNLEGANIYTNSASRDLIFGTDETERVRIDGSGRVGIGNAIPGSFYSGADDLVVGYNDGPHGITVYTGNTNSGALYFADGTTGDAEYRGGIAYIHDASDANENLALVSGGATKMRIRTTGYAELASASQVRLTLGNAGTAGANTANWIRGTGNAIGLNAASDNIHFEIGGSEKMRITSNGYLGVGKSDPSYRLHVSGGTIGNTNGDTLTHAAISGSRHHLDFREIRTADTGDWQNTTFQLGMRVDSTRHQGIDFVSDANAYEHIDIRTGNQAFHSRFTYDGRLGIGTNAPSQKLTVTGAVLNGNTYTGVANTSYTSYGSTPAAGFMVGASNDTAVANNRTYQWNMRPAQGGSQGHYLTFQTRQRAETNWENRVAFGPDGGIFFNGDTAAANGLDDYEEGTWTPNLYYSSSGSTAPTYSHSNFSYIKIGRLVFLIGYLSISNKGSGTQLRLSGLPFPASGNYNMMPVWTAQAGSPMGYYLSSGVSYMTFGTLTGSSAGSSNTNCPSELSVQTVYKTTS